MPTKYEDIDSNPLTPKQVKSILCVKQDRYLWIPEDSITFIPVCCPTIIGDGLQFVWLSSINQRPHIWYIRIDSSTDIEADDFDYDKLISTVEADFGCYDDECEDNDQEDREYEYPMMDWGGGMWGLKYNCKTGEKDLNSDEEKRSLIYREQIIA